MGPDLRRDDVGERAGYLSPSPTYCAGREKCMRHVKLRRGEDVDEDALPDLIAAAYADIRARLGAA